jgi:hypothetical protein
MHLVKKKKKAEAISATGREGPWGCETSRRPYFLISRLKDGGKVVSLTRQPPGIVLVLIALEAESPTGP